MMVMYIQSNLAAGREWTAIQIYIHMHVQVHASKI